MQSYSDPDQIPYDCKRVLLFVHFGRVEKFEKDGAFSGVMGIYRALSHVFAQNETRIEQAYFYDKK